MTPPGGLSRRTVDHIAWAAAGSALLAVAIIAAAQRDVGPLPFVLFVLLPDLAFLAGLGQPHAPRQLPPRAVPLYNIAHHPLVPVVVVAAAAAVPLPPFWLVGGLVWLVHIAFDRALGYGHRTSDGWQQGGPNPTPTVAAAPAGTTGDP